MKTREQYYKNYNEIVEDIFKKLSEQEFVNLDEYNNQVKIIFFNKLLSLNSIPFFMYYNLKAFNENDKINLSINLPINDSGNINWESVYKLLYEK